MATLVAKNKRILSMVIPSNLVRNPYGDKFKQLNIYRKKYSTTRIIKRNISKQNEFKN